MFLQKNKKPRFISSVFVLGASFLFALSFLVVKENVLAAPHDESVYQKGEFGTLTHEDWNNLLSDFVNTWLPTSMTGPLSVGTTTLPVADRIWAIGNIAGNESLKITNSSANSWVSGNFGIGNASAGASKLSIFGGQSIGSGYFSNPAPDNGLIVQGDTGIGINTTNPGGKLVIQQTMATTAFFLHPHIKLRASDYTDGGFTGITYGASAADNYGWSAGALRRDAGYSSFVWRQHLANENGTEYMRIRWDGNVGIGTTNPGSKLSVQGVTASDATPPPVNASLRATYGTGTSQHGIGFYVNTSSYLGSGIFSPPGALSFFTSSDWNTTNAVERMRISTTGNVGINTTNPTSTLHVAGTTLTTGLAFTENPLDIKNSWAEIVLAGGGNQWTTSGSDIYNTNYAAGKVGIGVTNPTSNLSVASSFNNPGVEIKQTSSVAGTYDLLRIGVDSWITANRGLRFQGWTNLASYHQYLLYNGYATGTTPSFYQGNYQRFSGIEFAGGDTNFLVNTGASGVGSNTLITPTKALTIQYTGNVGIGATNPRGLLHIYGASVNNSPNVNSDDLIIEGLGNRGISILNNGSGFIMFGDADSANRGQIVYNHADDTLQLRHGTNVEFTLDAAGRVGIGTISPTSTLHVEGMTLTTGLGFTSNPADIKTSWSDIVSAGGGSQWTSNGNDIYNTNVSTGKVGIGVTNPSDKLTIVGGLYVADGFKVSSSTAANWIYGQLGVGHGTAGVSKFAVNGNASIGAGYYSYQAPANGLIVEGNIGIGTNDPQDRLHVLTTATTGLRLGAAETTGWGGIRAISNSGNLIYSLSRNDNVSNASLGITTLSGFGVKTGQSTIGATTFDFFIDNAGKIGIGTTAPGTGNALNVKGLTPTIATGYGNSTGNMGQLVLEASDSYTTQKGGRIAFSGNAGTNGGAFSGQSRQDSVFGTIEGFKANNLANNAGGGLIFRTNYNPDGQMYERMRITDSGNVGIGTTGPQAKLHIQGNIATPHSVTFNHYEAWGSNATRPYLSKSWASTPGDYLYLGSTGNTSNTAQTAMLLTSSEGVKFGRGTDTVNGVFATEWMRINTSGNVGIGTSSPATALHVNGTITTNGLCFGSDCKVSWDEAGSFWSGTSGGNIWNNNNGNVGIGTNNPGTNKLAVVGTIAGSESIRISSSTANNWISGNLGVGNASQGTSKFAVFGNQSIGTGYYSYQAPTNGLIVQGNVGIGTTNPLSTLNVLGESPVVTISDNNVNISSNLYSIGSINFTGNDASLNAAGVYTSVDSYVVDTNSLIQGSEGEGGRIDFSIWRHDVATQPRVKYTALTINNNSNIGIGTTNPNDKFVVNLGSGISSNTRGITLNTGGANQDVSLGLANDRGDNRIDLTFNTQYGASTWNERMRITNQGNVGIGNTAPNANLQLGGNSNDQIIKLGQTYAVGIKSTLVSGVGQRMDLGYYHNSDTFVPALSIQAASGNVGIGTIAPISSVNGLDISSGGLGLIVGAENTTNTRTNNTIKYGRIASPHYINAEEPMTGMVMSSQSTSNILNLGGGTSMGNAATDILFYTAANNTTITGTERMRIASNGRVGIGTSSPATALHVNGTITTNGLCFGSDCKISWDEVGSLWSGTRNGNIWNGDAGAGNVGIGTNNPGTNKLAVVGTIAGSESIRISSSTANNWISGNLGVGNASQGTSKFAVFGNQSIGTGYYSYQAPTNGLIVQGSVGIGTTNPTAKLDVSGGWVKAGGYHLSDAATDSLLVNGDFETGDVSGWTVTNGSASNFVAVTGGYAGNYTAQITGNVYITSQDYIPVDPTRDVIQLDAYVKKAVQGTTPGVLYFGYYAYDANKSVITSAPCGSFCYFATSGWTVTNDGNWHKVSATTSGEGTSYPNFPVGTRYIRVLGLVNHSGSSDTVTHIDHISLKRINPQPLFVGNNFSTTNRIDEYQFSKLYTTNTNNLVIEPPSGGNVGIGTTNPTAKLSIGNGINSLPLNTNLWIRGNNGTGITNRISLGLNDNQDYGIYMAEINIDYSSGQIAEFGTRYGGNDYPALYLRSSKVGIGTTSPGNKLTISGGDIELDSGKAIKMNATNATTTLYLVNGDWGWGGASQMSLVAEGDIKGNRLCIRDDCKAAWSDIVSAGGGSQWTSNGNDIYNTNVSTGKVGIGVTNPSDKLTVVGGDISGTGAIKMANSATSSWIMASTTAIGINSSAASRLAVWGNQSIGTGYLNYSAPANGLIVEGSVGIGTTNPVNASLQIARDVPALVGVGKAQIIVNGATDSSKQMMVGFDTTSNYGFIQTLHQGVNWSDYNLALQPVQGNVGIGTTSPVAKLEIVNTASNGTGVDVTTHIGGSNYFNFANDRSIRFYRTYQNGEQLAIQALRRSDNLWMNLLLNPSGGNVGIGTTNPGSKLDVSGVVRSVGIGNGFSVFSVPTDVSSWGSPWYGLGQSNIDLGGGASTSIALQGYYGLGLRTAQGTLVMKQDGNVGIGTTNPTSTLHVEGMTLTTGLGFTSNPTDIKTSWSEIVSAGGGNQWTSNGNDIYNTNFATGKVGIGVTNPTKKLDVVGGAVAGNGSLEVASSSANSWIMASTTAIGINSSASSRLAVWGNQSIGVGYLNYSAPTNGLIVQGNVGIGTSSPEVKLDVIGGNLRVGSAGAGQSLTVNGNSGTTATIFLNSASKSYGIYQVGTQDNYLQGDLGIGTTSPNSKLTLSGGDFEIDNNKSIKVSSATANTTLLFGNYADSLGFYYGTSTQATNKTVSLAVEGDVKADRLCIEEDCKAAWSEIVSAGGGNQWTSNGNDIYNTNYATGKVGVGVTNPASKLSVASSFNNPGVEINQTSSVAGAYDLLRIGADSWTTANRGLRFQSWTNLASYHQYLLYNGYATGTTPSFYQGNYQRFSGIEFAGGDTNFLVNTGASGVGSNTLITPTKALTIQYTGKVGIGDTNPSDKLTVLGGLYATDGLKVGSSTAANWIYGQLGVGHGSAGTSKFAVNGNASIGSGYYSYQAPTDGLIVQGNVGIGTTNPGYKLDVAGAIAIHDENQDIDSRYYGGTFLRGWSSFSLGSESNISYVTDTTSPVGNQVLEVSTPVWARGPKIPLDITQNYEVEMWVKRESASTPGLYYFVVSNYDSSGTRISGDGTDWHYPVSGLQQSTMTVGAWTKYRFVVGPYGGAKNHNPNAKFISIGFLINHSSGSDVMRLAGFKIRPIPRYNNDALTITNSGNIGIGSTNIQAKLDVNGTSIFRGEMSLNGNKITNVATGTNPNDVVIKSQLDSIGGAIGDYVLKIGDTMTGTLIQNTGLDVPGLRFTGGAINYGDRAPVRWARGRTGDSVVWEVVRGARLEFSSGSNYSTTTASIISLNTGPTPSLSIGSTINLLSSGKSYLNGGNVGIGDTNPSDKLTIIGGLYATDGLKVGSSTAANWIYGQLGVGHGAAGTSKFAVNGNASIGSGYYSYQAPTDGLIVQGNVGIGLTNPSSELHVRNPLTSPSYLSYEGTITLGNTGSVSTNGLLGRFQNNGDTASGSSYYTYLGNNAKHVAGSNYLTYRIGNGWIPPSVMYLGGDGKIGFLTSPHAGTSTSSFDATLIESMTILRSGNVGIGNTNPSHKLSVTGTLNVTGMTSLGGGATITGNLNMGGGDITSINKISAAIIDPLYNIQGINYSTFASAIVGGLKEEYVGRISATSFAKKDSYYESIIDLSKEKEGSDLWVWRKVVDFNDDNIEVFLTPRNGFAQAYSLISGDKIIIRSDKPIDLSMRLVGNRFDWRNWPTKPTDQSEKALLIIK